VISMDPSPSSLPRALPFFCPICPTRYPTRKLLLEHVRSNPETSHKALGLGACESAHYPQLQQKEVMACPLGCGAYFNGGEHGDSNPLEFHVRRANCRDRRPLATPAELDGTYLATTIAGVKTPLTAQARIARSNPHRAPPHSAAVEFCCENPGFTPVRLRTSGCQSAVVLPKPCITMILLVVTDQMNKTANVRGEVLWEAAWDALFQFSTLVLGPQKSGASSSVVKT